MEHCVLSSVKFLIATAMVMLPCSAYADYYYDAGPDPFAECYTCYPHHHMKAHAKHHHISSHQRYYFKKVDVYYPAYAPCAAGGCGGGYWAWIPAYNPREYVTFSYVPARGRAYEGYYDAESYDMRTADDDVCSDPDMNNQY